MSGVAAVSIGGETAHSAAYLNGKIPEDGRSWANALLLIIDEVSFIHECHRGVLNVHYLRPYAPVNHTLSILSQSSVFTSSVGSYQAE